jgi:D-3-phosphoglycerate dehydrogenase
MGHNQPRKVLITADVHEDMIDNLEGMGFLCDYEPTIEYDEVIHKIAEYFGLVVTTNINVDAKMIDAANSLRFIARAGSGMENINEAYAHEQGILCINSPEGNRDAVGEHVIGMLLTLLNNIAKSDRELRNGIWLREENRGIELKGKTVGIIGFGNTGQAFAGKLKGFGVDVLAHDKYKTGFGDDFVEEVTLGDIQRDADIVSVHLPLTEETLHYLDLPFLSKFSKPIYLVNTSRGKILDTESLIEALKRGIVLGAALDVFENEDLASYNDHEKDLFSYLTRSDRVILSPHIAGWTRESKERIGAVLVDKISNSNIPGSSS